MRRSSRRPPSDCSRQAVDLTALDTFIEFKRRIGTAAGYDPALELHGAVAAAGVTAAAGAEERLAELREERGKNLTITIIRRELRKWLLTSTQGKAVETAVARLLVSE